MIASNRPWLLGTAGAVVLLAAGGYFLGVQPQLDRADAADAQTTSIDAQSASTQVRITAVSKVAARQSELEQEQAALAKAVPNGLQANTFYRRVSAVAALDSVEVSTMTQSAGTAYAPPAAATAGAASTSAAATGAAATPSASTAPTTTSSAAPLLVATDPKITSANLTIVPTVVSVTGTPEAGLRFADDIQGDERLFLVSGVSQQPNADDVTQTVTTLTGSVYVLKY